MDNRAEEHPLTIKVMRLTRPSLLSGLSVTCDARDLPGELFNLEARHDPAALPGLEGTGPGHMLVLPQSFGNIYLGETFSCCICVHNNNGRDVSEIKVKAMLQIRNERFTLMEAGQAMVLQPDSLSTSVIVHEVKQLETHVLFCAVDYRSSSGELQNFHKFYKFQVLKPIDIKTRIEKTEDDTLYIEATIENITTGPICLEKVTLEPTSNYSVQTIDALYTDDADEQSLFGAINCIMPSEARQYLYTLTPSQLPGLLTVPVQAKDISDSEGKSPPSDHEAKPGTETSGLESGSRIAPPPKLLGKLNIVWRSNLGEKGVLQTSQLEFATAPQQGAVSMRVTSLPAEAMVGEAVPVSLRVVNIGDRTMLLRLEMLPASEGFSWQFAVAGQLPPLPPHSHTDYRCHVLPLKPGLQNVCGLRMFDINSSAVIAELPVMGQMHVNSQRGTEGLRCGAAFGVDQPRQQRQKV